MPRAGPELGWGLPGGFWGQFRLVWDVLKFSWRGTSCPRGKKRGRQEGKRGWVLCGEPASGPVTSEASSAWCLHSSCSIVQGGCGAHYASWGW